MPRAATIVDRPDLTLLDTREQPWEGMDGIAGGKQKVLARDEQGAPSVQLTWIPPGLLSEKPERHFHRTVHERGYVLFGELPMREYASPDQEHGRPVVFKQGYYMDRGPGSVHGLDPAVVSPVGFLMLEWRTGPGTYLLEEAARHETVVLPAAYEPDETPACPAESAAGTIVDSGKLRLLDTRAMPWEVMDGIPGARWKVLSCDSNGNASVALIWLAPRPARVQGERHYYKTVHMHWFCLGGELPMREFEGIEDVLGRRVVLRNGVYMNRRPGSVHGSDASSSCPVGLTVLEWRSGPGTYPLEDAATEETCVLPASEPEH
jgi:hypothetical protein